MNLYQRRILEARKEFLKLNLDQEKELLRIYQELSKQLSNEIASCRTVSSEKYLKNLNDMVQNHMNQLNIKLSNAIESNIETSSQIASSIDLAYYESVTDDVKLRTMFNKMVLNTSRKTVSKLIQGNYYADGKTLDRRIWNITKSNAKDIDTLIKTNIARGANARSLAQQLERYINPAKRIEAKTLEVGMSKSISYQAQRLARTSITHSFAETTVENAKKNPFCKGVKWNLNASHSAIMHGKTDICDDYAGRVFKPNEIPLQHPQCRCYFTEENEDIDKVIKELKAWTKGENNPKLDKWFEDYNDEYVINTSKARVPKTSKELAASKEVNSGIIRVDKPKDTVSKYEYKISNVKWYNYLNISKDNSDKLNEIHSSLNEFMHINNREKVVLLDIESNNIIHELEGTKENEIKLTKETEKILKNSKENSIILSHNHPSKTTFSRYDIQHIIRSKSIKALTVECIDGTKYIINRGILKSSFLKDYGFLGKYKQIYDKIAIKYPELDDETKIIEIWDKFLNEVTEEIAQKYGMDYRKVE